MLLMDASDVRRLCCFFMAFYIHKIEIASRGRDYFLFILLSGLRTWSSGAEVECGATTIPSFDGAQSRCVTSPANFRLWAEAQ
jgi:hypothetical protein